MRLLNKYFQIIIRLSIVLLIFQICRLLFILFNGYFFPDIGFVKILHLMVSGLRYDIAAILLINLPYLFFMLLSFNKNIDRIKNHLLKFVFITTNLFAIILNIIDIFYFPYTLNRLSISFFSFYLGTQKNITILIFHFLGEYWYAVVILAAIILIIVRGYNRVEKVLLFPQKPSNRTTDISVFVVIIYLTFSGIYSSWIPFNKLLTTDEAWDSADNPFEIAAVTNTPYNILFSQCNQHAVIGQLPILKGKKYILTPVDSFTKKNVVIFILESFTKEASGLLNPNLEDGNYKGYTPFLDSLMQHSLYFTHAYANGRRSIDAIPAILSSLPSISPLSPLSYQSDDAVISIASLLKNEGYVTQFFHGADNGSMGFDRFCKKAGIDEYYGLTEFNDNNEFDGTWGIWDEPFLQFTAQKQLQTSRPFFSTIFNLSSHNPYVLPLKYAGKFKEGIDPICKCISYTDYSIRNYFNTVSKMPWFHNTIFIFTADHSIIPWHTEYQNTEKAFAIPLFFYTPDGSLLGKRDRIAQQIDILPTVLCFLKYPDVFSSIGNNLLDTNSSEWAVNEIMKIPQQIEKGSQVKWIKANGTIIRSLQKENPKSN